MLPKAVISCVLKFFLFFFNFLISLGFVCDHVDGGQFSNWHSFSSSLSAPQHPNVPVFEPGEIMMQTMIHLCFSQICSTFQDLEDKQRQ